MSFLNNLVSNAPMFNLDDLLEAQEQQEALKDFNGSSLPRTRTRTLTRTRTNPNPNQVLNWRAIWPSLGTLQGKVRACPKGAIYLYL